MVLNVKDVVVSFGAKTAVDGVSLEVAQGEIVGLLGPSGCGKSTLLRAISGLVIPQQGMVTWDGVDLAPIAVHKRGFGFVFQDGQLFAHKSVAANVAYGLAGQGISRVERKARVAELLELVGLSAYEQRNVTTLSGGEKQRIALARALAPRPRVLLLDEPLSALDRELRERLALDLRAILRATGTTAVFVTHDQDEAFTVCDRVAVMREGKILQIDRPERLWRHPASREIAEFLGYEAVVSEQPFKGYAPCDFEVVETMEPEAARVLSRRFGQDQWVEARELGAAAGVIVGANEGSGVGVSAGAGAKVGAATGAGNSRAGGSERVSAHVGLRPAPTGPVELAGVIVDKYFQSGRAVARAQVPGVGMLTVAIGKEQVEPGDGVRLLKV